MHTRGEVIRRRRAVGVPLLEPEIEVINIGATHSGQNVIDISQINTIGWTNFTHIHLRFIAATRSSGGSNIEMDLRPEGGAFGTINKVWHEFSSVNLNRSTADIPLTTDTATTVMEGDLWMTSVNQLSPTGWSWNALSASELAPGNIRGMTNDGDVVHDAIRLRANGGGGGETWSSGTIVVMGYRLPVEGRYTGSVSGATEDVTLGKQATMADVFFKNHEVSAACFSGIQVGTGGTFVSSNHAGYRGDSITCETATTFGQMFINSDGVATTGRNGWATVLGLNTQAPVVAMIKDLGNDGTDSNPQEVRHFMTNNTTTKYDQLRLLCGGGQTFSSGTYTIIAYKPRTTIHHAGALPASNVFAATGLTKRNASLMVFVSHDATRVNAGSGVTVFQSGSGGYSTDYDHLFVDEATDTVTSSGTSLWVGDSTARAAGGFWVFVAGVPQDCQTCVVSASGLPGAIGSGVDYRAGSSNTKQVEDQAKIQSTTGPDPSYASGNGYIIGFSA